MTKKEIELYAMIVKILYKLKEKKIITDEEFDEIRLTDFEEVEERLTENLKQR